MKPDEAPESEGKSAFNMAFAYIHRLDDLLTLCNKSSIDNNLKIWFPTVKALYRELCPFMNEKQKKEIHELLGRCHKSQADIRTKETINSYDSEGIQIVEILLREVMSKRGLLVPRADDPSQAVLK